MARMKLPTRGPVGDIRNMRRVLIVNKRLHALGKKYRKAVPKRDRSYRSWLEFLQEHEPILVLGRPEENAALYAAAPRG